MELSPSWEAANCAATQELFMEPVGSLLCSQEPSTTGPYPEPDQSNLYHPILSKIHFNMIHPPTAWSSQWSPSFWLSHQYPICIPPPPHSYYTWRRVQVMKLLIMQFCPRTESSSRKKTDWLVQEVVYLGSTIFANHSRQMLGYCLEIGYDRFLPYPLHSSVIITISSYRCYMNAAVYKAL
jgi:hypothetical protein